MCSSDLQSNMQLSSGIAPIRRYLVEGMNVGLGTDVAGGASLSMFRAVADLVGCSKLRWRLVDQNLKPLSTAEAFYVATVGGCSFFGKVGSFEERYDADILVLDDSQIRTTLECDPSERVERYMYLAEEGGRMVEKYVAGRLVVRDDRLVGSKVPAAVLTSAAANPTVSSAKSA